MKKIVSITVITFIIIFMFLFIINKKQDFSYNENRYLKRFPEFSFDSLKNGKYLDDISSYINDHFPLREEFIKVKSNVENIFRDEVNGVFISDDYLIDKYNGVDKDRIINKFNYINDNTNSNNEVMLIPTSISIYDEYLPKYAENTQIEDVNYIYDNISLDTIDVYDLLKENKDNYQLYYHMDHHWTIYGSYMGYMAYSKHNNLDYKKLNDLNISIVNDKFMGTIYSKVLIKTKEYDKIYNLDLSNIDYQINYFDNDLNFIYDDAYLDLKDKYSYYLSNNDPIITINSSINDKEILIVKDSYANNFIPYLMFHYGKITIIDPRYYKLSIVDYINENNIDNVLFLFNMNTIETSIYTID